MSSKASEIKEMPEFKNLVAARWKVAIILTILEFICYYGFILMVAYAKPTLATKIGTITPVGIVLGVGVIFITFLLTLIYVLWANNTYDQIVASLKRRLVHS